MITTIRYPLLFRARPPRTLEPKNVFCSIGHVHEVPEVSASETRPVTEVGGTWPLRSVEHGGRLFRYLGDPGGDLDEHVMSVAFMRTERRHEPWRFTFEGGNRTAMPPLSQPLYNTLLHRLYMSANGPEGEEQAWPYLNDTRIHSKEARDTYRYEDIIDRLTQVDVEQLASMRREHAREADKLLLVDGHYWIETPPPVICVGAAGYGSSSRMDCEVVMLPEWVDSDLGREYFPISERARALEYAREANLLTPGDQPVGDYIHETTFGDPDDPLMAFEFEEYSHTRTVAVLAGDAARQISKNRAVTDRIGAECARSVLAAREVAMQIGTAISEWPDLCEYTQDVVDAWKGSGRKPGWAGIPQVRRGFADMICDRAIETASNRPISITPRAGTRPQP